MHNLNFKHSDFAVTCVVLMLLSPVAWSAPVTAPVESKLVTTTHSPADQYNELQSEIRILDLKAKKAELEEKIRQHSMGGFSGNQVGSADAAKSLRHPIDDQEIVLLGITGFDEHLTARLQIGGHEVSVHEGETVSGWVVHVITDHGVSLERGKKSRFLRI